MKTAFQLVSAMNVAFGNPQGEPAAIEWERVRKQCLSIGHEFVELLTALGATGIETTNVLQAINQVQFEYTPDLLKVRDALIDGHVFGYGAHHLMGINADRDMRSVLDGVMSRFVKDSEDQARTIENHMKKGVAKFYFEGEYPTRIMKSAEDQPDAPKGKFLKSASYKEPVFYDVLNPDWCAGCTPENCGGCPSEAVYQPTGTGHVWQNRVTGKFHYSDEAEQIDPTPYDTEGAARTALGHYIEHGLSPAPAASSAWPFPKGAAPEANIDKINGTAGDSPRSTGY